MKNISLLKLYLIFFKIGAILLGGGYVILPILINELTKKRNLIEQDEIIDYFALSQSLPGIIAANISMFVGYKLHGKSGAIIAMFGIISAPFISIIILASIISALTESSVVQGVFWGINIAVIALIILTVREVWRETKIDLFFFFIFVSSIFALLVLNFSPVQTIILFTIIGITYKRIVNFKGVK